MPPREISAATYDSGIELSAEEGSPRKKETLSLKTQLAYGVGHVFNDVCASVWLSYLLIFLNLVIKLENWQAGFLLLLGQISDACANPIIGYISDRQNKSCFFKYGKRKSWHLVGTILLIGTYPFTLLPCLGCEETSTSTQVAYYSGFVIIFQFGWAAIQNSHLSLIPELSHSENDSTKLAATRYCFTVISNLMVYISSWITFRADGVKPIGPNDAFKFANIMWVSVGFGLVTSIIFHLFVKEKPPNYLLTDPKNSKLVTLEEKPSLSKTFRQSKYYRTAMLYMSTMLFVNMGQVFVPLYLHESLKMNASSLAVIPLIIYSSSFVTSFVVEAMNRRSGRKASYVAGAFAGLVACIWVQLRSQSYGFISGEIYVVSVIFGIANCIVHVTNLGITSDVIGPDNGNGALLYAMMTLADKLSCGVAVFVIENLHNRYPGETFYQNVIAIVCGSSVILGSIVVLFFIDLRKEKRGYIELP